MTNLQEKLTESADTTLRMTAASNAMTARLALCAIVGPVLGTVAWLVLGLLRPGYSMLARPVSALGIGPDGILMDTAFVLNGLLVGAGVVAIFRALRRELGPVARWASAALLMITPLGLVWLGIFTMNELELHNVGAQLALGVPVLTLPVVGFLLRRAPRWRRLGTWMLLGGPLTLGLLAGFVTSVPFSQMAIGGGIFGLWQRALGVEVQAWYVALACLTIRLATRAKAFKASSLGRATGCPGATAVGAR